MSERGIHFNNGMPFDFCNPQIIFSKLKKI